MQYLLKCSLCDTILCAGSTNPATSDADCLWRHWHVSGTDRLGDLRRVTATQKVLLTHGLLDAVDLQLVPGHTKAGPISPYQSRNDHMLGTHLAWSSLFHRQ